MREGSALVVSQVLKSRIALLGKGKSNTVISSFFLSSFLFDLLHLLPILLSPTLVTSYLYNNNSLWVSSALLMLSHMVVYNNPNHTSKRRTTRSIKNLVRAWSTHVLFPPSLFLSLPSTDDIVQIQYSSLTPFVFVRSWFFWFSAQSCADQ